MMKWSEVKNVKNERKLSFRTGPFEPPHRPSQLFNYETLLMLPAWSGSALVRIEIYRLIVKKLNYR